MENFLENPDNSSLVLKFTRRTFHLFFSATWPSGVRRLASQYSNNPIQVVVGSLDLEAVNSVTQTIEIIDEDDKRERVCFSFVLCPH